MGVTTWALLLLLVSATSEYHEDLPSTWLQLLTGFISGLQRNPATLSNCQTLLPSLATKWGVVADSVTGLEGWETLYDLRDFFTALDFWTQTCNFVTLLNYVKLNVSWNLLITRIFTNLTFYAVSPT